jgi:hypothetical protein
VATAAVKKTAVIGSERLIPVMLPVSGGVGAAKARVLSSALTVSGARRMVKLAVL